MTARSSEPPSLLRFLAMHLAVGVAAGWSVLGVVFAFDLFGLRTLILTSSDGVFAAILLAFFFALTFGSLGMGFGVMTQPRDEGPHDDGFKSPRRSAPLTPAPARVRIRPPRRG